ncbi:MAG: MFS transporter [Proteobacteria bacterium]|nr:MFS transporter [Pseudomonadota bacterium]
MRPVTYRQGADWPPYARRVLIWNWLAWLLNFTDRGMIGPLLPLIIAQLGISYATAGSIVSLFFVGYLSTFFGGLLSDRLGRKKLCTVSLFGFGLTTCATSLATGVGTLSLARVVTGIFEGLQYPAAAAWVSESFPFLQRARALAIWETGYSLGTLLGIVLATFLGAHFGWRAAWPVGGGLTLCLAVLFARFAPERSRRETPGYDEAQAHAGTASQLSWRDALGIRNVWVVFVLHGLYNFTFWMAGAWIPLYVIKTRHMSMVGGGLLSAILFAGVSVGLVLNGFVADRFGRVRAVSFLTFLAALALALFTRVQSPVLLFVLMGLGGVLGAYISSAIALVTDTTSPEIAGTAFGIALFGGEIGAVLGPITGGFLAQTFGLQTAIDVLPLSLLAASLIVWLAKEPIRHAVVLGAVDSASEA